jgi:hypothetical protein
MWTIMSELDGINCEYKLIHFFTTTKLLAIRAATGSQLGVIQLKIKKF